MGITCDACERNQERGIMSEEAKNTSEADPTGSVRVDAGVRRKLVPVCCLCGAPWKDGHDCQNTARIYREVLEMIATVNACDYEYQRWAREALGRA